MQSDTNAVKNIDDIKIDLVYLWCDSSDPVWLAKKNAAQGKTTGLDAEATAQERWIDNDELKYSLRSAELYAPWVNHIFIITDNQTPSWLDTTNTKITIVDHKDIIPAENLPLFNASAIECYLANIERLSEYFLFANDDMFFGRPVCKNFFFNKNGTPIVYIQKIDDGIDIFDDKIFSKQNFNQYTRWLKAAARMVYKVYGKKYYLHPCHNIDAYRKSYILDNINDKHFKEMFEATKKSTFRRETDLQRIIFTLLDNVKKRNVLVGMETRNPKNLFEIKQNAFYLSNNSKLLKQRILEAKPYLFCINDYGNPKHQEKSKKILQELFPDPSSFEKNTSTTKAKNTAKPPLFSVKKRYSGYKIFKEIHIFGIRILARSKRLEYKELQEQLLSQTLVLAKKSFRKTNKLEKKLANLEKKINSLENHIKNK